MENEDVCQDSWKKPAPKREGKEYLASKPFVKEVTELPPGEPDKPGGAPTPTPTRPGPFRPTPFVIGRDRKRHLQRLKRVKGHGYPTAN